MASKKKTNLSPREERLIGFLKPGQWATSSELMAAEFRGKKRPDNARLLVTVAMYRLMSKLRGAAFKIEKRGGGRGGVEYLKTAR